MKILIPVIGFGSHGGYRVLSRLADEWLRMGHNVSFLAPEYSNYPYFPTNAEVIWLNDRGECVSKPVETCRGGLGVLKNIMALYLGLNREAKRFDIILANHNLTVWPVALAYTSAKKTYYVQAYEPEYYKAITISKCMLKIFSYISYHLINHKIVNSPVYLKYKNLRASEWVPPGLDFTIFYPRKNDSGIGCRGEKTFVIGCIGRKEPEKGIRYVTEAFISLRLRNVPVRLKVAYGNIPEDLASREDVEVVVPRNDRELGGFYQSVDVLVAPGTVQHGAPHYPVMEAMACGVPVITTGYMPANSSNSWLVPVGDADAIVRSIEEIMEAGVFDKVDKALSDIEVFSWPIVARKFIGILQKCVSK